MKESIIYCVKTQGQSGYRMTTNQKERAVKYARSLTVNGQKSEVVLIRSKIR